MNKLKEHIRNFDWSLISIIKLSVASVVVVISLVIILGAINFVTKGMINQGGRSTYTKGSVVNFDRLSRGITGENDGVYSEQRKSFATNALQIQSQISQQPSINSGGGSKAEQYERRDYSAQYQTRKFEATCKAISGLKPLEYVVFDNSNVNKDQCNYTFRVKIKNEEGIIAKLKALNPRSFNINTSTIERSIEYSDSAIAMQKRRLKSTEQTLEQAENSFNSLITQATREGNVKVLADVINNKLTLIDRLNRQLLNIQDQLDRLTKSRGNQMEQIAYAHFSVSVTRLQFINTKNLNDSWKTGIQIMVTKINAIAIALSVGLLLFLLQIIEIVVFGAIVIVVVALFTKVFWKIVKRIWRGNQKSE